MLPLTLRSGYRSNGKSPLHPSALRCNDLTPGRTIVRFHRAFGVMGRFTVISRPFAGYIGTPNGQHPNFEGQTKDPVVILRNKYGRAETYPLSDLGVIPYSFGAAHDAYWNPTNFTIDHRKLHLLPAADEVLALRLDSESPLWDEEEIEW